MSINKIIIKGRLGGDPENRSGVVNFSVATDDGYKDKDGNKVENTNWHRVTAFGKLGEILEKWVKKGDEVIIIGRVQYREHEGKYYTNIIANEFDFVGSNKSEGQPNKPPFQTIPAKEVKHYDPDNLDDDDGLPF